MNNLYKYLATSLIFSILSLFTFNQVSAQEVQAGVDIHYADPQGDFEQQLDNPGIGFSIWGGYRLPNTPVLIGIDFGFTNFGVDTREEPLSTTIPDLRVEVENRYNLLNGNLLLRLISPSGMIRPYAEGLVGFNYFFTETVLRERGTAADGERLRDTNFSDVALSYGFGGGLQIRVYQDRSEPDPDSPEEVSMSSIYLNLQGRYMFGREAEYLQSGSIQIEDGDVTFDVSQSETDLLYFKLGVVFAF